MSYTRLETPTFFPDGVNYIASRGWSKEDDITIQAGTIDSKYLLFDQNPLEVATFSCNGTSTILIIEIDRASFDPFPVDFVFCLNNNFQAAGVSSVQIRHHTAAITTAGTGSALSMTPRITDEDWLQTSSSEATARYVAIVLYPATTWTADLTIGQIIFGKSYTVPVSGDLNVKSGFDIDSVNRRTSSGGKRFATAGWISGNDGHYMPFRHQYDHTHPAGRQFWDVGFSLLDDTDLVPADLHDVTGDENLFERVIQQTVGSLNPFVFSQNGISTSETDYMYARLDDDRFTMEQIAYRVQSIKMRIEQEI